MGVVSLVFGILCVILCWIPVWNWVGIALGVIGIIMGAVGKSMAKKNDKPTGVATAGLVLSIIGVAIAGVAWLACFACAAGAGAL